MRALTLLALLVFASSARADWFTVDASDPNADFQDLQVAIDGVPDGSVLLLIGKFHASETSGPFVIIDKSLTLVGERDAEISNQYWVFEPAVRIAAPADRVTLRSIAIFGLDSQGYDVGTPALCVTGCSSLLVDQCKLVGGPGENDDAYNRDAGPGVWLGGDGVSVFTSCEIVGGDADTSDYGGDPNWVDGFHMQRPGPALDCHSERVVLKDCTVRGGNANDFYNTKWWDGETDLYVRPGGDCIDGISPFYAHCTFSPGQGGTWWEVDLSIIDQETEGETGIDPSRELPDTLSLWEWSFFIGSDAVIEGTGTPRGLHWLFYGFESMPPIDTASGWFFMPPPYRIVRVRASTGGSWLLESEIPFDYNLVGIPMYFQAFDLAANQLSCLEAGVIGS